MSDLDNRPSIGELQRLSHQWRELSLGCQCDALPGDAACGVHLPPVLLEIAAAALELREQERVAARARHEVYRQMDPPQDAYDAVDQEDRKLLQFKDAYDAALAKVRP